MAASCEDGNESTGPKKYGEFLDKLSFKSCILKDCSMERCVTSYRGSVPKNMGNFLTS